MPSFMNIILLAFAIVVVVTAVAVGNSESMDDAAGFARTLVKETSIGVLMSNMDDSVSRKFAGHPFGIMDYYVDTCPSSGDLLLLMSELQINVRNIKHDSRVSFTIRQLSNHSDFFPMASPRVTLIGEFEAVPVSQYPSATTCFLAKHPDAKGWIPNRGFHDFRFYTFRVRGIYYIGGFGGLHYIGFIDEPVYRGVSQDDQVKLEVQVW